MHEFSIASSILDTVERQLGRPRELTSVTLTLGPLSGVCADSLRFCFALIAAERGFGEPELIIREVPARLRCQACEREYALEDTLQPCPHCGSYLRTVLGGDEFTLDAAEYEEHEEGGEG